MKFNSRISIHITLKPAIFDPNVGPGVGFDILKIPKYLNCRMYLTKFSAAIYLDLLEPVVDFSIDRLHRDLQPRRRHWLRQADDVPVFVTLSFDQNQIIISAVYSINTDAPPLLEALQSETSLSWFQEIFVCSTPQGCAVAGSG